MKHTSLCNKNLTDLRTQKREWSFAGAYLGVEGEHSVLAPQERLGLFKYQTVVDV